MPPPVVAFDPVGEIVAYDRRGSARDTEPRYARDSESRYARDGEPRYARDREPVHPRDREPVHDPAREGGAAARAAMADAFAARFGVDESGPSADALADRFGFRYEEADAAAGVPGGRRTVTITGQGARRAVPPAERTLGRGGRTTSAPRESFWLAADRAALWAVGLALVLALVAAISAHAVPLI